MSKPTTPAIKAHLQRQKAPAKHLDTWARYLQGLDWSIIRPLAQIAINSNVHPSLAAGMVIRSTRDQGVADTLRVHLKARATLNDRAASKTGGTNKGTPSTGHPTGTPTP